MIIRRPLCTIRIQFVTIEYTENSVFQRVQQAPKSKINVNNGLPNYDFQIPKIITVDFCKTNQTISVT